MSKLKITFTIIFLMTILIPFRSFSQETVQQDLTNDKLLVAAREIMTAAGNCALITLDENDLPMVRTMDPFLPEKDFTVWFGTNPNSRKVNQIKTNPNVTLYYLDKDASGYVVIHGKAQLVDDQTEKGKHWKTEWETFYPNKTKDYLLIKVTPQWMEVLSTTRGITGDPKTWKVPVIRFD